MYVKIWVQIKQSLWLARSFSSCRNAENKVARLFSWAVLRALLTIATAEHFIVHGDCLMQVKLSYPRFSNLCKLPLQVISFSWSVLKSQNNGIYIASR